jgi:F0F1-type ATP synthase membrane subunit b/b'
MKYLLLSAALVVAPIACYAQAAIKKALQYKSDSIFNLKAHEHANKIDSINNVYYIQALERSNTLQSGNNTFYSVVFGGIGVLVTIVIVVFGFNFFTSKQDFEKNMKEQRTRANKLEERLRSVIKDQTTKLNALREQNTKAINDLIEKHQEALKTLMEEAKKPGDQKTTNVEVTLNKLSKDIESLKRLSIIEPETLSANFVLHEAWAVKCKNCGTLFDSLVSVVCPKCGTLSAEAFPAKDNY